MRTRSIIRLSALSAAALVLAACSSVPAEQPPSTEAQPGQSIPETIPQSPETEQPATGSPGLSVVTEGLASPWSIAFYGETPLISERDSGRILELDDEGIAREVATLPDVHPSGEGGLLGLAVHDAYLYAYFTAADGNRVERFPLEGAPGSLTLGAGSVVVSGIPSGTNHNGGRIAFGPDKMLYVTTGDAGRTELAQDTDSLAGKILRLNPDGSVPDDNPFLGSAVYSYGHRNVQGIAWDADGTMYASEFGNHTWDELNVIQPGNNYGWPLVEGIAGQDGLIDPVQQWPTDQASPSGIAARDGSIWMANLRGSRLTEVPLSDLTSSIPYFEGEYGRMRDVVLAPDGSLWILTNNTDGRGQPAPEDDRVLRMVPG